MPLQITTLTSQVQRVVDYYEKQGQHRSEQRVAQKLLERPLDKTDINSFDQEEAEFITFGIDEAMRYRSSSVTAFKSGNSLAGCNRATINNTIDYAQLHELDKFYAKTPYRIWIDDRHTAAKDKLIQDGFSCIFSRPFMAIDLNTLEAKKNNDHILVRCVENDDELFNIWVSIVIQAFFPDLKEEYYKNYAAEFVIFIKYLQKTVARENLFFYLGFLKGVPVATGMFVLSQNCVGVHWIGTLPEFRNNGVGFVMTHAPLHELKLQGAQKALLWGSPSGYSIYEKIGFRTLLNYEAYAKKQN